MSKVKQSPWIAQQEWKDILFLHWPMPYDLIRANIPAPFELQTFNGNAWISVVSLQAKNSRLRGMPKIMSYRSFLQVNVRTYVTFNDEPGVYFFSIDANSPLAVVAARSVFSLPYLHAIMNIKRDKNKIMFTSKRKDTRHSTGFFSARYQPLKKHIKNSSETLDYWLTDRYNLWTIKGNKVLKGPLSHEPWILNEAKVDVQISDMNPFFIHTHFQAEPLIHYTATMEAYLHPFKQEGFFL